MGSGSRCEETSSHDYVRGTGKQELEKCGPQLSVYAQLLQWQRRVAMTTEQATQPERLTDTKPKAASTL